MADNPHASWFFKYEWDFDAIPTGGEFSNYMRALLCCANGDGQLQPGEREWVVGYAGTLGVPDELLDELRGYPADDDIAELIKDDTAVRDSRRAIIYDAVRACAADGDRRRAPRRRGRAGHPVPRRAAAQVPAHQPRLADPSRQALLKLSTTKGHGPRP